MIPVFRFAPSPNGRLHLGHAYSAVLNAKLAAAMNGRFLVRIEDIDLTRCTKELERHCLDDLGWLGLTWGKPVRVQSEHFDDYKKALDSIRHLLFPCFCSRKDIAEISTKKDPDGAPIYPGTCKSLSPRDAQKRIDTGEQHCWRLNMQKACAPVSYTRFDVPSLREEKVSAHPERWGDVILARKETPTSYHLSVVVDDALQGVTHVVRGKDLEAATDLHALLQKLLNLPTPLYHHHDLITEPAGEKLSKSKGSESIADLRARGVGLEDVLARLTLPV